MHALAKLPDQETDADGLIVRVGTVDDVHEIMKLALAACEENGFVEPNPQKLLQEIYPALARHEGAMGVIGEPGGIIEGVILLRIGRMWYSDERIIEEKAIFIHPDYRQAKGGRAAKLCRFSKKFSDELGLPLVIGVLSNERTQAKVRMYQREFGPANGAYWIYGAKTGLFDVR